MTAPVLVRCTLPASPERVFDLFTQADQLALWFCEDAQSDLRPGGAIRAGWVDEEGETWTRSGRWVELDRPFVASLEWFDEGSEVQAFRIAIAPHAQGCTLTVLSPALPPRDAVPADVLLDAVRQGWEHTLEALAGMLRAEHS